MKSCLTHHRKTLMCFIHIMLVIFLINQLDCKARHFNHLPATKTQISPSIIPRSQHTVSIPFSPLRKRINARARKKALDEKPLPQSFGKTHFIAGFPHKDFSKKQQLETEKKLAPIISTDGCIRKALFSPDDDIRKTLLELIAYEKSSIKIAIFSFTDEMIAGSLTNVCTSIPIELITDPSTVHGQFSKIHQLCKKGVHVYIYNQKNKTMMGDKMHDKFILFGKNLNDKPLLWTGSFNFSKSANDLNQENVLILDDQPLIEQFNAQFAKLKKRSRRYQT